MRISGRTLLSSLLLLVAPAAAHATTGGAWTVGRGEWYSEVRMARTSSNASFLGDLRDAALPGGRRVLDHRFASYNEVGIRKNVALAFQIPFDDREWSAGRLHESVAGLSDLSVGLRVRMRSGTPAMVMDLGWKAPLGYEKDTPLRLGNGRQEAFGGFHAGFPIPAISGFAQVARGFRFLGEESGLYATTSADVGAWVGSRLLVGARYRDHSPISGEDPIGALGSSYAAGPVFLVRVDDRLDLMAGSFHDWAGRNSLRGDEVYVAMTFKQSKLNRLQGFLGTSRKP